MCIATRISCKGHPEVIFDTYTSSELQAIPSHKQHSQGPFSSCNPKEQDWPVQEAAYITPLGYRVVKSLKVSIRDFQEFPPENLQSSSHGLSAKKLCCGTRCLENPIS